MDREVPQRAGRGLAVLVLLAARLDVRECGIWQVVLALAAHLGLGHVVTDALWMNAAIAAGEPVRVTPFGICTRSLPDGSGSACLPIRSRTNSGSSRPASPSASFMTIHSSTPFAGACTRSALGRSAS